ncbi:thioesterase family protein [Neptunomonas japonica]|uniref:thioesterase family protein n=1 Tax=Neptunomonas japonica TaxID=417574 RepID=UPI000415CFED|nr:thioesterase family protein [Neptunomonas japonica]
MHIDELLSSIRADQETLIPDSWAQGRTTFGGLTAAILCESTKRDTDPARYLRNFEIGFVRPLEALKPFEVQVETLANGKTVTIKSARIIQDGKVRATARADYVLPLDSNIIIDAFSSPKLLDKKMSAPLKGDHFPSFFQHFDNYVATEGIPFSGQAVPELGGWMKFKETPEKLTDSHLICVIDSWPPAASPYYDGFKPLSTLSWSIHFANPTYEVSPAEHLGYLAKVNFGENGLSSSQAEVWGPEGQLLARSFQTNIIYG